MRRWWETAGGRIAAQVRSTLAAGFVAATLSIGIGVAVFGATVATVTVAAGGLGVAHGACQSVEAGLAADLGISVAALRAVEPTTLAARVAARQAAGALTPHEARRGDERAVAYTGCRQTFTLPIVAGDAE